MIDLFALDYAAEKRENIDNRFEIVGDDNSRSRFCVKKNIDFSRFRVCHIAIACAQQYSIIIIHLL